MSGELINAMYRNNLEELERLLQKSNSYINKYSDKGNLPLHYAIKMRNIRFVRVLVEHGADVNLQDGMGHGPLCKAIWVNKLEIAEYLINNGANVNARDHNDNSLLVYAFKEGPEKFRFVKLLVDNGAYVNRRNKQDYPPLLAAILNQGIESVEYLVRHGADINDRDQLSTPLQEAIDRNNFPIFKFLVDSGADVNLSSNLKEFSPLHFAIQKGNLKMIKYLVEHGADVDIPDYQGITALQYGSRFYWEPNNFLYGHRNRDPVIIDYFQNLKRSRVKSFFDRYVIGREQIPGGEVPALPDDVLRIISDMAGNNGFGKKLDSDIRYLRKFV